MATKNDLRIALLIDGDNAQPSLMPLILEALKPYGRCVIQRVYGDWTAGKMTGWRKIEQTHAVQLVQQSRYATGKNATDIAVAIAAMDILHSGKVDAFCLVSSDSDFTPLVIRLKDEGAKDGGVGKTNTPPSFVNACSVFIATDSLTTTPDQAVALALPTSKSASGRPSATPDPRSILKQAYAMASKEGDWVFLGILGQSLRKINPKFKTKTYGQKGLAQLILQCGDCFETRVEQGKGKTSQMYVKLKT
jgi:hypothetical protein